MVNLCSKSTTYINRTTKKKIDNYWRENVMRFTGVENVTASLIRVKKVRLANFIGLASRHVVGQCWKFAFARRKVICAGWTS
jgi:hypothetical protein